MNIDKWRSGKWTRLDWIRFFLHLPVGALCSFLCYVLPVHGVTASVVFLAYETLEDWRIADNSFKDVLGFAWGFSAVAAAYALAVIL